MPKGRLLLLQPHGNQKSHKTMLRRPHPRPDPPARHNANAILATPPEDQQEIIHTGPNSPDTQPVIRGCGWFAAVTTCPESSAQKTRTYFTKAVIKYQVSCLELPDPFNCGIKWQKVDDLRYTLKCPTTATSFEVHIWADPALLNATILVGSAHKDTSGEERFLECDPQ
jgi:hypothetical protein